MAPYGKVAQVAIAAISRLAEVYEPTRSVRLSSKHISEHRKLSAPLVAKVLVGLSQAGLVDGVPGPGGGYALAKSPADIRLIDVAKLFGQREDQLTCPFGPEWCGHGPHCPLHEELSAIRDRIEDFLERNTLAAFAAGTVDAPRSHH